MAFWISIKRRTIWISPFLLVALGMGYAVFTQSCSQPGWASQDNSVNQAKSILERSGVKGGLVVHLHCGNGILTEALRTSDSYLVHGLDSKTDNVTKARQHITSRGSYGAVSVDKLTGKKLPYIDSLVNLILAEDLGDIPMEEVMRVLAPKGVLMIRGLFGWKKIVKPAPRQMDEWNQYLYNSEGNMVSKDEIVGPAKHYQWIGSPKWGRHHDTIASMSAMVSANGRVIYIMDEGPKESIQLPSENYLVARDAFNGTILWKRPIKNWQDHMFPWKSGPAYLPRRLVAVGDRVYVTLGIDAPLSELDAATGKTLRTFPKTDKTSEVVFSNNTLFLVVGRPEKTAKLFSPGNRTFVADSAEYGRTEWAWSRRAARIMAIKLDKGSILWEKASPVAPLTLTADSKSVYFYNGRQIVSVNRRNGRENWKSEPIITRKIDTAYAPRVVVHDNVLVFSIGGAWPAGGGRILALSTANGKKLWYSSKEHSGHYSPEDMFVIDGLVWSGATAIMGKRENYIGRDLYTGEVKRNFPCDVNTFFFHQRCYPSKATTKYIIQSRAGIEFVDTQSEHWTLHHYTRGGCLYGIMPSNGLIYTPPHACSCYIEAKLAGMGALGPALRREPDLAAASAQNRLEKGPAYGQIIREEASNYDWPTYRHDPGRSGYTSTDVSSHLKPKWQMVLGGKLSSPVVAGNMLYVTKVDAHSVYALNSDDGRVLWRFKTGGRVDSPPTIYKGRVLFGSADGYVYCLRAFDGALIWRFRAAPLDRRMVSYEQLESVWPVSGSVLVQNNRVYCVAGRTVFLDGGMRLLQLDPKTGKKFSETILDERDPETGRNLHEFVNILDMPVGLPDILSSDGKHIYMRSQQFDMKGKRTQVAVRNVTDQSGEGAHVFSPIGFLDDSQFVRSYMMYGKGVQSGWGGWETMGKLTPSGRLIVVDEDTVYGFQRKPEFLSESIVQEFQLYAAEKAGDPQSIAKIIRTPPQDAPLESRRNYAGDWKLRQGLPLDEQTAVQYKWIVDEPPLHVRAMVLANKTLFISGPPDIVNEEDAFWALTDKRVLAKLAEQSELNKGKKGGLLWAVSASSGKKLAEYKLASLPVWDGMAAANGELYMTTLQGDILCFTGNE
jgi:outer membrane protein assembly factor BamB